ncbi:MAG: hypothetical protein K2X81_21980 [Candidatus Obscuribacterales bacterium]|nr:hypothetical protein [Candidatus Obscuribacterales bacterium]
MEKQWLPIGLEFVQSSIENLKDEPTEREVRTAIILLYTGVELIFKSRLAEEVWPLAFDDPKLANLEKYKRGEFKSVGFDDCLKRLQNSCGINLSENEIIRLDKLRNRRNNLVHQGAVDDSRAFKAVAASAIEVLLTFIKKEYEEQAGAIGEQISDITKSVFEVKEFLSKRLKSIEPKLKQATEAGKTIVNCPKCQQHCLVIAAESSGILECWCCDYQSDDPTDALEENKRNPPIQPERYQNTEIINGCCNDQQLLIQGLDKDGVEGDMKVICFVCGDVSDEIENEDEDEY